VSFAVKFPNGKAATEATLVKPSVRAADALTADIPEWTGGPSINVAWDGVSRRGEVSTTMIESVPEWTDPVHAGTPLPGRFGDRSATPTHARAGTRDETNPP
jgi:hypothetical protein